MKNYFLMMLLVFFVSTSSWAQEEDLSDVFEEVGSEEGTVEMEESLDLDEPEMMEEKREVMDEKHFEEQKNIREFAETLDTPKKSALDSLPQVNEEESKEISRLFEKAAKNYNDILDNRPEAEMRTNEKRLNANKGLLKQNRDKLATSQSDLRRVKLAYIKRFLILKNSYKRGAFTKATYDLELAKLAKSYEFKVRSLIDDTTFYKGETKQTKERVKALDELNRINRIMNPKKAAKSQKKKNKKPLTELEKMMKKVQSTGDWYDVKDVWDAPDRN
ncbi:hypothetical protein [Candidatus Uabimicrobium sp. HlEnr_7]|uniref:hypothetical protein n=1 Tax=Candidatus Uabimicrobium helgolandensis TaxID=3095367 RepID=UPI0035563BD1